MLSVLGLLRLRTDGIGFKFFWAHMGCRLQL